MRWYDGPWHDMQAMALAFGLCGPSGPIEAVRICRSSLWQPLQVTPVMNIGPGMSFTPRPPLPA